MNKIYLELCLDSVESAVAAERGGADRIELCTNLDIGGTTPSAGLIAETRKACEIKVHILIRPRGGDFVYSEAEFNVMRRDIALARNLGADGVVFGVLTGNGRIDVRRTAALVSFAQPMSVTFHRAFDRTDDPFRALEDVIRTGADRILTSGCGSTAIAGERVLRELVLRAARRIIILPGGGVSSRNIIPLIKQTGVTEVHVGRAAESTRVRPKEKDLEGFGKRRSVDRKKVSDLVKVLRSR
jgi:copper homeostasis protein